MDNVKVASELTRIAKGLLESGAEARKAARRYRPGDRVEVAINSGIDSGKSGTVENPRAVRTDGRGIPTNVDGAYDKPDWRIEVPVRLDDGSLILMEMSRLRPLRSASRRELAIEGVPRDMSLVNFGKGDRVRNRKTKEEGVVKKVGKIGGRPTVWLEDGTKVKPSELERVGARRGSTRTAAAGPLTLLEQLERNIRKLADEDYLEVLSAGWGHTPGADYIFGREGSEIAQAIVGYNVGNYDQDQVIRVVKRNIRKALKDNEPFRGLRGEQRETHKLWMKLMRQWKRRGYASDSR